MRLSQPHFSFINLLISSFRSLIWKSDNDSSWMRVTLRDTSLRTCPRHFSHMGIEEIVEGALGRRWRAVERIPDSAAWAARKRKSIDCAFSELRAIVAVEGCFCCEERFYRMWR